MNYDEISTDTIITNHQQVGDTLVRMNDNTSHIKVKLDELDRSIGELKTAVEDIQSDGDYPTENRVQEMISDNLEDHDVSCQIDEALDNRDYLGRDEVEEHVDQRIEYHTDDLPTKSDIETEVSDQLGNFDWSDVVYDEDLATKSYVDDEIEGQVEDAVKDASSDSSQLFDLISKVLQAVDKDQFEVWVGVLKQSGVEEYKAEQAERERQAKLPELPKLPLPTGPAIDSSASLLVDES